MKIVQLPPNLVTLLSREPYSSSDNTLVYP